MLPDTDHHEEHHERAVHFEVDGERFTSPSDDLTPNRILVIAGLDPADHYLTIVRGRHQESLQGRGAERLEVHDDERFVSASTKPTPVS